MTSSYDVIRLKIDVSDRITVNSQEQLLSILGPLFDDRLEEKLAKIMKA